MWMKNKGELIMYYAIIIILFIILYGVFIYSLLSMVKKADLLAEKLYKEMRGDNEDKSNI